MMGRRLKIWRSRRTASGLCLCGAGARIRLANIRILLAMWLARHRRFTRQRGAVGKLKNLMKENRPKARPTMNAVFSRKGNKSGFLLLTKNKNRDKLFFRAA